MTEPSIIPLRIPNPFSEGRNQVYLIPCDPVTLIDTGTATDRSFNALVSQLDKHGVSIRDIGRVILTHKHIDHIGNAWRIQQESNAEILIHESEMQAVADVDPQGVRFQELVTTRLCEWNVPENARPKSASLVGRTWAIQSATPSGLAHGQTIDTDCGVLEVLHTPGHTNGSICLKFDRQLFSGDHVLPTITPNVGGGDLRHRGLLSRFLESLDQTLAIAPDIDLVFPGHGIPFNHLAERCQELIQHHQDRLKKTESFLRQGGLSAYDMAKCLFGELHDYHVILGCAEAQAHLEFLVTAGRVRCQHGQYTLQSE